VLAAAVPAAQAFHRLLLVQQSPEPQVAVITAALPAAQILATVAAAAETLWPLVAMVAQVSLLFVMHRQLQKPQQPLVHQQSQ
jgi:hypothetical protein